MKVVFTQNARDAMAQQNVSLEDVEGILNHDDSVVESPTRGSGRIYTGHVGNRDLSVMLSGDSEHERPERVLAVWD